MEIENHDSCEKENIFVQLEECEGGNSVDVKTWKEDEYSHVMEENLQLEDNHKSWASKDPFSVYELLQMEKQPRTSEDEYLLHTLVYTPQMSNSHVDLTCKISNLEQTLLWCWRQQLFNFLMNNDNKKTCSDNNMLEKGMLFL